MVLYHQNRLTLGQSLQDCRWILSAGGSSLLLGIQMNVTQIVKRASLIPESMQLTCQSTFEEDSEPQFVPDVAPSVYKCV